MFWLEALGMVLEDGRLICIWVQFAVDCWINTRNL